MLQHQQGSYILTIEAGRQLLLSADGRAEVTLQTELTDIQDRWKQASTCLEEQKKELSSLLKVKQTEYIQFNEQMEQIHGFASLVLMYKFHIFPNAM